MHTKRLVLLGLAAFVIGACGAEGSPVADPDRYVPSCEDYFETGETDEQLDDAAAEADRSVRDFCEEIYDAVDAQVPLEMDPEVSPGSDQDDTPKRDVPQGTPPGPAGVPQSYP